MSRAVVVYCPFCGTELELSDAHLQQADGKIRCGSCLQLFDTRRSEQPFQAPTLPEDGPFNPLANISVHPMEEAELPQVQTGISWTWWLLILALGGLLLGQIYRDQMSATSSVTELSLGRLLVRPHPHRPEALRVDAIIRNHGTQPSTLPLLSLSFQNGFGEIRAQRTFAASEYLRGQLAGHSTIPANSEIQIELELLDPGQGTVNYSAQLISAPPVKN
jgi:predicted Zn finger-like uncharacterized protein